jgi:hypothetical protein
MENKMSAMGGSEHSGKKIILASLFIVVFIFGLISGIFYYKKFKVKSPIEQEKICWGQAKQRLTDSGLFVNFSSSQEIKSVYGTVTAISGNKITLKIKPLDIFADPELDTRIIEFTNSIKYYRVENAPSIDPASSAISSQTGISGSSSGSSSTGQDRPAVNENNDKAPLSAPNGYKNEEIKARDVKVGDTISVLSDNDIRNQKNIQASFITVLSQDSPPQK